MRQMHRARSETRRPRARKGQAEQIYGGVFHRPT